MRGLANDENDRRIPTAPNLPPQPPRHRLRRTRPIAPSRAQIRLAHGGDVDLPQQRPERRAQRLILRTLRRQQHDRVVARDRVPRIVQRHQVVFRDQAVAGGAGDHVDFAGGHRGIHRLPHGGAISTARIE
jgi:hypothetical protein